MDWQLVETFVAVVRAGSFSRAAAQLHLAQPAVGKRIRRLEDEVGATLLHRSARGVTLTQAGIELHARVEQMRHRWAQTVEAVRRAGPPAPATPPVRLGTTAWRFDLLAPAIEDFYDPRPVEWVVDRHTPTLSAMLSAGELDAVVCHDIPGEQPTADVAAHIETVCLEPVFVQLPTSHPLATAEAVTLAELRDEDWLVSPPSSVYFAWEKRVLTAAGVRSLFPAESGPAVRHRFVEFASPLKRPTSDFVTRPVADPLLLFRVNLVWRPSRIDADEAHRLVRALRAVAARGAADNPAYARWLDTSPTSVLRKVPTGSMVPTARLGGTSGRHHLLAATGVEGEPPMTAARSSPGSSGQ